MPSRKSNSSETQPESRRSSLRRLSSIASFHTLFARRKGTSATDTAVASSSSNLSLSLPSTSTANDASAGPLSGTATTSMQHEDSITALTNAPSAASRLSSKRSSYVCLPDDPIGGMPRSRTFSNLPVPVKARKASNLSQSQSHARLPSALPTSTRIPTPPTSTRIHSHSRLASVESKVPVIKNRVKRSDTEPLLPPPAPSKRRTSFGRSTAFKENLTLSPVKPLPPMDLSSEPSLPGSSTVMKARLPAGRTWRGSSEEYSTREVSAFGYVNPYASHPAIQIAREHRSSPAYKSDVKRKPTPGASMPQAVQRWNSQPVLTNVTNNGRPSLHGEIRQSRLMSARQAPTPALARTPLVWEAGCGGRAKSSSVSSYNLLQTSDSVQSLARMDTKSSAASPKPSALHISNAEPAAYWAGRLCALTDRFRNEELAAQLMSYASKSTSGLTPKGQTDKMHTPEATTARTMRALDALHELCVTPKAKESLMQFQTLYARQSGLQELAPPKPPTRTIVLGSVKDGDSEAGDGLMSETRKASFMDRLLGRQKRKSLVLV